MWEFERVLALHALNAEERKRCPHNIQLKSHAQVMPHPETEAAEIQAIWDQPPEEEDDSISENEELPTAVSWDDLNWAPQEGEEDSTPWSEEEVGPSSQPVIPRPETHQERAFRMGRCPHQVIFHSPRDYCYQCHILDQQARQPLGPDSPKIIAEGTSFQESVTSLVKRRYGVGFYTQTEVKPLSTLPPKYDVNGCRFLNLGEIEERKKHFQAMGYCHHGKNPRCWPCQHEKIHLSKDVIVHTLKRGDD